MENVKSYNFSSITMSDLDSVVSIQLGSLEQHQNKFRDWFEFNYKFKASETNFLKNLIKKHILYLSSYSEEKLKMKFLALLFDKIDFVHNNIQDWYDSALMGTVNGTKLSGLADFMIAKGLKEPQKPYFFIQEFKPTKPDHDPEVQLLAEMLVAIEKNQTAKFYGGYIIGRNWYFVILEKIGENNFEYFVSPQFDSLKIEDLKQIYICLQAVKLKYCVD